MITVVKSVHLMNRFFVDLLEELMKCSSEFLLFLNDCDLKLLRHYWYSELVLPLQASSNCF